MKNDRPLTYLTTATVALIHAGIIALAWNTQKLAEPVAVENLTFIDLGSVQGDDKPLADGAPAPIQTENPAPVEPPKKVEPKPESVKKEPIQKTEPKVKTVVRDDRPADVLTKDTQAKNMHKPIDKTPPDTVKTDTTKQEIKQTVDSNAQSSAKMRAADGVSGGQGTNPNSKAPGNPASDHKDGDGKGKQGSGDKPGNNSGVDPNQIVDGGYIRAPHVNYPLKARENEEEGAVTIEFTVEPNGAVSSSKVVKSSGSRTLDNAALAGVRTGQFKPKTINGVAVRSRFKTKFEFTL